MSLELLRIERFASFENVAWQPERLNVLIGPNGSGKSNLLRALDLIRASAAGKLSDFFIARGGFPRFLWGAISRDASFYILMTPDGDPVTYYFRLSHVPESSGLRVVEEKFGYNCPEFRLLERPGGGLYPEAETALSTTELQRLPPIAGQLLQQLKAWTIYQGLQVGEDTAIRRSAVDRRELRIAPDGQNLVPVLKTLYEGDFKEAIDSGMSAAFPDDFGELLFRSTEPNRVQLYLRRKHGSRRDSAADLSDGTLRFLLLLAILAIPDPPPS
jgi:predicted ATPase